MKTAKKLLAVLLCMCMVMSCVGFGNASAEILDHMHIYDSENSAWVVVFETGIVEWNLQCKDCEYTKRDSVALSACTKDVTQAASCTQNEIATFSGLACVTDNCVWDITDSAIPFSVENVKVPNTKLPHTFLDTKSEWKASDDYSAVILVARCENCVFEEEIICGAPTFQEDIVENATCTKNKVSKFSGIAVFGENWDRNGNQLSGSTGEIEVEGTAHHTYGAPTAWSWNNDYSEATATFTCEKGDDTQEVKTTNIQANDVIPLSCTTDHVVTYTATVNFNDQTYTSEPSPEVTLEKAEGHKYGASWSWNNDYSEAIVTLTCEKGDDTQEVKTTNIQANDVIARSCTTDHVVTYTATAEYNGQTYTSEPSPEVTIEQMEGHTYGEPTWDWKDENQDGVYESVKATFACEKGDDTQIVDAAVYSSVVTDAGCTTDEVVTYTAIAEFGGKNYSDVKENITLKDTKLEHSYAAVTTEPTCTKDGYTTYTCTRCQDTYTANKVEALGHSYNAVTTEATCTEGGYTTYTCERCRDTYTANEVKKLEHSYDATTVPATCTKDGSITYKCSRCGFENADMTEVLTKLEHSYNAVTTDPTCTTGGYTTYTCDRCQDTYTANEVDALGHTYDIDFNSEINEMHTFEEATFDHGEIHTFTCTRCRTATLPIEVNSTKRTTHNFPDNTWVKYSDPDPDNGSIGTCKNVCVDKGCTHGPNGGPMETVEEHVVTVWTYVPGSATCYFNGYQEGICERCGATARSVIAEDTTNRPEHTYAWTANDATTHTAKCTECAKAGVEVVDLEGVENSVFVEEHTFGEWIYDNDETILKNGHDTRTCALCGYKDTREAVGTSKLRKFIGEILGASVFAAWIYTGVSFWLSRVFGVSEAYLTTPPEVLRNK